MNDIGQEAYKLDFIGNRIYKGDGVLVPWDYTPKGLGFRRGVITKILEDAPKVVVNFFGPGDAVESGEYVGAQCVKIASSR